MTIIDIILLVVIGAGAVIGFIKGFIRQLASILGLIVGLLADVCPDIGVCCYLDSGSVVVPAGSGFADEGDGSSLARLAESLAGCRTGRVEVSAAGESAYLCCRVYRLG